MKKKILKKIPKLNSRVDEFLVKIENTKFLKIEDANVPAYIVELQDLEQEFSEIAQKRKNIQIYQSTMDMGTIEPFNNVEDTKIVLNYRAKLWNSIFSWRQNTEIWQVSAFEDVNVEDILEQATQQAKIVLQCERHLPADSSAVHYLKKLVFEFKETMPIVEALGNNKLKEVHWDEIKEILNIKDFPLEAKQFSLGQLVDFNVHVHADEI